MSKKSARTYPLLPTRADVVLPGVLVPLEVGRALSLAALDAAVAGDGQILVVPQLDPAVEAPLPSDLFRAGVLCEVMQVSRPAAGHATAALRAIERRRVEEVHEGEHFSARVSRLRAIYPADRGRLDELASEIRDHLALVLSESADAPSRLREGLEEIDDPEDLVDIAAAHVALERDLLLELLGEEEVEARLRLLVPILARAREVAEVKAALREELDQGDGAQAFREKTLREQARAIASELGEADDDSEADEMLEKVEAAGMPAEVRDAARRQIRRLRAIPPASPEYVVARNYVQWLLDVPWATRTEDTLDVAAARRILDADHTGLEEVKKRIIEFIAVRKLAPDKHGPILCLVGPPGVGKTSLGRSIAAALGRRYARQSLGGVRDEAEIRGHRRTYIGALPGRIVSGLSQAGSMNPVFVLDEIDKLAQGDRGDPAAALLEVLDPEQNSAFADHYLEVPVDLSQVLFLATANQLETIPPALLDRMEVIQVPGYTDAEKLDIARRHLLPRQLHEHGLPPGRLDAGDDTLLDVVRGYTRESGVRNLEREIAALCRAAAVRAAEGEEEPIRIEPEDLGALLGPVRFDFESAQRAAAVGLATGLAWTPTGGDVLFIEARKMPGKAELILTGHLGGVMRESVEIARSWVRANAGDLGIPLETLAGADVHLHVPEGATPKDGPSAGVAVAVALASVLSGRAVRADVAITGELTLRGRVLPVGGVKSKILAAHRAGLRTVLLPERNEKDLFDIPASVRDEIEIQLIATVAEALDAALVPAARRRRAPDPRRSAGASQPMGLS